MKAEELYLSTCTICGTSDRSHMFHVKYGNNNNIYHCLCFCTSIFETLKFKVKKTNLLTLWLLIWKELIYL